MKDNYADVLESYMIEPALEALDDETKGTLASMGVMAAIVAVLGIQSKFKQRKQEKEQKKKIAQSKEVHARALKEAFSKVDQKYKLSSMTKDEYNKFVNKMYDEIIKDIQKMLRPLNSKEVLNKLKNEYIARSKKLAENGDYEYFDDDVREAEKSFKPGLFKIVDNSIGDYVCIIDGSQEINSYCHSICENVAEALATKYSEFVDAGLFGIGTGDGDEGSVYPEFVSYESMRKHIS